MIDRAARRIGRAARRRQSCRKPQISPSESANEALASPQWQEWRATIDKELNSLREKQVYVARTGYEFDAAEDF